MIRFLTSALTTGTVESGSTALGQSADAARGGKIAITARAGLALMLVDRPAMLEIAQLAVGLHIIPERGPAGRDRFAENRFDGVDQLVRASALDRAGLALGREAGVEQRLGGIDVADPGDYALIEDRGFDRGGLAFETRGQGRTGESGIERLGTEALDQFVPDESGLAHQIHHAEAARIVEAHMPAIIGLENNVIMRLGLEDRPDTDQHPPAHAKMAEQNLLTFEMDEYVFGAAIDLEHPATFKPPRKAARQGKAQILATLLNARQAPA